MSDAVAYSALGVTFGVASDDVDVLELIDRLYVHCRISGEPAHAFEIVHDGEGWALGLDGATVLRDAPASLALERFAWEVNQLAWSSSTPGVFVHAGAVRLEGAGVLLCAGSGRGKSTLTMGLCERGARYLSDEIAVLDIERATMHGFARPIALRYGSWPLVERLEPNCPPEVADFMDDVWFLVPPEVERECAVDAIVFPIYDPTVPVRLDRVEPSEAVAILADQSPNLVRRGPDARDDLARLVGSVRCRRLVFSDLAAACELVAAAAVPG
jgi:hypothetical protein